MKRSIALFTTAIFLASCASSGSKCIDKSKAENQPFKFSSDAISEAFNAIPSFRYGQNEDEDANAALALATKALNDFEMTPEGETRFLKNRLEIHKKLLDTGGARADIERMKALGTLHEGEAEFRLAQVERLGSTPNAGLDRDAQPLIRFPPLMSQAALRGNKSGNCVLEFDVAPIGVPENIRVGYCTDDVFRESSIKSLAKWKYNPAIRNGVAVPRKNVETNIRYVIMDACGTQLPG